MVRAAPSTTFDRCPPPTDIASGDPASFKRYLSIREWTNLVRPDPTGLQHSHPTPGWFFHACPASPLGSEHDRAPCLRTDLPGHRHAAQMACVRLSERCPLPGLDDGATGISEATPAPKSTKSGGADRAERPAAGAARQLACSGHRQVRVGGGAAVCASSACRAAYPAAREGLAHPRLATGSGRRQRRAVPLGLP